MGGVNVVSLDEEKRESSDLAEESDSISVVKKIDLCQLPCSLDGLKYLKSAAE